MSKRKKKKEGKEKKKRCHPYPHHKKVCNSGEANVHLQGKIATASF
jgi:hypothetical protein